MAKQKSLETHIFLIPILLKLVLLIFSSLPSEKCTKSDLISPSLGYVVCFAVVKFQQTLYLPRILYLKLGQASLSERVESLILGKKKYINIGPTVKLMKYVVAPNNVRVCLVCLKSDFKQDNLLLF